MDLMLRDIYIYYVYIIFCYVICCLQGENSRFLLHLEGTDKDAFSVSPTNDMSDRAVLILVKNPNAVDYEKKKSMSVQVGLQTNTTSVRLTIRH